MANQAGGGALVFGEDAAGSPEPVKSLNGALISHLLQLAFERNPGTANQYGVGVNESNIVVLDGVGAVLVSDSVPALLFGLHNTSAGVVTATIVGMLDQNDVARTVIYSLAANESKEFRGAKVAATFSVTASVTQVLAVEWRAQ